MLNEFDLQRRIIPVLPKLKSKFFYTPILEILSRLTNYLTAGTNLNSKLLLGTTANFIKQKNNSLFDLKIDLKASRLAKVFKSDKSNLPNSRL